MIFFLVWLMSRELTEQQKEFCRRVAMGQSGRSAYAAAFGCEKESSAGSSACRMLKRDYIRAEIDRLTAAARELSRQRDARAVGDKAQRMEMLWRMARECESAGAVGDAVKCIAELNRLDGAYEPEKVQVAAAMCSFDSLMEGMMGGGKA